MDFGAKGKATATATTTTTTMATTAPMTMTMKVTKRLAESKPMLARILLRSFRAAAARLTLCLRYPGWKSLLCRTARRKRLTVCETTALGDRRFISVVQFERQRFLVASCPGAIRLLSRLSDDSELRPDPDSGPSSNPDEDWRIRSTSEESEDN